MSLTVLSLTVLYDDHGEVILKLSAARQAGGGLERIDQRLPALAGRQLAEPIPADVLPDAIGHDEDHPGADQLRLERDEERLAGADRRVLLLSASEFAGAAGADGHHHAVAAGSAD